MAAEESNESCGEVLEITLALRIKESPCGVSLTEISRSLFLFSLMGILTTASRHHRFRCAWSPFCLGLLLSRIGVCEAQSLNFWRLQEKTPFERYLFYLCK